MKNRFLKLIIETIVYSLILLCISAGIWYFKKESGTSYQDILFWVSVAPIAFFTMGRFGSFESRGGNDFQHANFGQSRHIEEKTLEEFSEIEKQFSTDIKWIIAGVLVFVLGIAI